MIEWKKESDRRYYAIAGTLYFATVTHIENDYWWHCGLTGHQDSAASLEYAQAAAMVHVNDWIARAGGVKV